MDILVTNYDSNFPHNGQACLCGWPVARLADDWMLWGPEGERQHGEETGSYLPHAHWPVVVNWTLEGELILSQRCQ